MGSGSVVRCGGVFLYNNDSNCFKETTRTVTPRLTVDLAAIKSSFVIIENMLNHGPTCLLKVVYIMLCFRPRKP